MTARAAASRLSATSPAARRARYDDYLSGQQVVESDVTTGGDRTGGYQYLWSPRYIDAPVLRDTLTTAGTGIVACLADLLPWRRQLQRDGRRGYNSGTGAWQVVERYSYTPYGS